MKEGIEDDGQLSHQMRLIMADLKCQSNCNISRICDNANCTNTALFCSDKQCVSCFQPHQNCRSYAFEKFTKLVQRRSQGPFSEFMERLIQIEKKFIKTIEKLKKKQPQHFILDQLASTLDKRYFKMVEDIFRNKNSKAINGRQATELFEKLEQTLIQDDGRQDQLLESFTQQVERISKEYLEVKEWICDSAFGNKKFRMKQKEKKQEILPIESNILKLKNKQLTLQNLIHSNSTKVSMFAKIIEDQLQRLDKIFIKQSFIGYPKVKFELVFRASQHDYSAAEFHQTCDNIQNTFILVQNQHNKVLAGFTPLTWFGENIFKNDETNQSFLLSLDEKIKMILNNKTKAIYCSQSCGPTFGGESHMFQLINHYDLQIGDKCNINNTSCFNFPRSYQFYQRSADIEVMAGTAKGKKFKIVDYQVFRVTLLTE